MRVFLLRFPHHCQAWLLVYLAFGGTHGLYVFRYTVVRGVQAVPSGLDCLWRFLCGVRPPKIV